MQVYRFLSFYWIVYAKSALKVLEYSRCIIYKLNYWRNQWILLIVYFDLGGIGGRWGLLIPLVSSKLLNFQSSFYNYFTLFFNYWTITLFLPYWGLSLKGDFISYSLNHLWSSSSLTIFFITLISEDKFLFFSDSFWVVIMESLLFRSSASFMGEFIFSFKK